MSGWQLQLLIFTIFIGFSFFSWLFKQIAKKRAEVEQQRRIREARMNELRTGRSDDSSMDAGRSGGFEQPMFVNQANTPNPAGASSPMDERQRKLAELRRRAAQRSGAGAQASGVPGSAQVLAPQTGDGMPGVIVLPGGVTIRVNAPQAGTPGGMQGGQVVAAGPGRMASGSAQQNRKQKQVPPQQSRQQQNRPPRLTAEQQAQQQRQQAMARQPVPRPAVSRLPVSDTPDMEETRRLNADTDAPTVTGRPGRKSPVRNLVNLSQRDLRAAFVMSQVFGPPRSMQ
jgi:hypothetical protein